MFWKTFLILVIGLGIVGFYGLLYLLGAFQTTAFPIWNHGVSWALLMSLSFGGVAALRLKAR